MEYWNKSFGFYLAIGGMGFYLVFLALFMYIDKVTIPMILARLIARVKRLELKGFKQKEAKKLTVYRDEKGKIVFIRHDAKKVNHENPNEPGEDSSSAKEGKESGSVEAVQDLQEEKVKKGDEENVAEAYLTPAKMKSGKIKGKIEDENGAKNNKTIRKAFKDEEDDVAEVVAKGKK
jgi:hypothetical protein